MPGSLDEEPIGHVGGLTVLVELTDGGDHRDRDQVPAADAAALTLHPTLLVGALQAGPAEQRVEPEVAAQGDEPLVLDAVAAPQKITAALATKIGRLPAQLRRSVAWDQSIEMVNHTPFTRDSGVLVYFTEARAPW